jgi:hypothetical protein
LAWGGVAVCGGSVDSEGHLLFDELALRQGRADRDDTPLNPPEVKIATLKGPLTQRCWWGSKAT